MATIKPFKGIRYNQDKVRSLADIVTPPYDVIDQSAQERYYNQSPYNIIRLEYGKVLKEDNQTANRYTRAAEQFKHWLSQDILVRENEPALYFYEQEFSIGLERKVRTGFLCAVGLEPYEKGIILPHEETLPKHKADRLELMRACKANFSPVFSLYADPQMAVTDTLREAAGDRPPNASFTDENGDIHRLWVIGQKRAVEAVQHLMTDTKIFIADGHHRYETALNYQTERQQNANTYGETSFNYVMMALVNLYDPGLVILPTHRLIKNVDGDKLATLSQKLQNDFTLEAFQLSPNRANFKDFMNRLAETGTSTGAQQRHRHAFGIYQGNGKLYLASLKNEERLEALMPKEKSSAWQGLDVSVLHCLMIEKHLGIGPELLAKGDHVSYTREEEGALEAVDRGDYQLAFFLNSTQVEEVTQVAANGEKMPQKSTFFYPKVLTGLVINPLD